MVYNEVTFLDMFCDSFPSVSMEQHGWYGWKLYSCHRPPDLLLGTLRVYKPGLGTQTSVNVKTLTQPHTTLYRYIFQTVLIIQYF